MKITNGKKLASATAKAGLIGIALVAVLLVLGYVTSPIYTKTGTPTNVTNVSGDTSTISTLNQSHAHAAMAVFVNGALLNFSDSKHQNRDMLMHFENGDGFTLHKHSRNAWLGPFFESITMKLADDCLTLDNGSSYCTNFSNQISFQINGKDNNLFEHYTPKDGDRILLSYGNASELVSEQKFLNTVKISRYDEK